MAEGEVPLILVSGASGFIASHCIKLLLESGEYRLRGTVRSLKNEKRCEDIRNIVKDPKYPIELVEANLLEEECWKKAVQGCTYVLHIASPFTTETPKHEDELIKPAVDGTLNVLKAAREVGGVKRVVLTSSMSSIMVGHQKEMLNESLWSDTSKADTYSKSKTLAEKAAWDFIKDLPDNEKFELSVINPSFVFGPILLGPCESSNWIKKMMMREMSMLPDIQFAMIDVRDVAKAHIIAITLPEAAGNRHILASDVHSFLFVSTALAKEFSSQGYRPPTKQAPKFLLWCLSWFNKDVKTMYPSIGLKMQVDNARMREVLKIDPIAIDEAVVEMAYTMIERGLIPKSPQYKGRKTEGEGLQGAEGEQKSGTEAEKEEQPKEEGEKEEAAAKPVEETEKVEEKKEEEAVQKEEEVQTEEETEEAGRDETVEKEEDTKKEEDAVQEEQTESKDEEEQKGDEA